MEKPYQAVKLSNMRRTIARRLTESKQTIPHFYLTTEVILTELEALRKELNAAYSERGKKISLTDLLIKALGMALSQVPDANVRFSSDELLKFEKVDISIAVSVPGGLVTPVIANAGSKQLAVISEEMRDLTNRARLGKLAESETAGGTATLSNLGMYRVRQFTAIINPPQGMILAVGSADKRPLVVGDGIVAAMIMSVTGSFDHRAIDGVVGAQLIDAFRTLLEKPIALIV
jgi:pyruvate dehydrogenase E2 component (dihydrolipoamide acetyltransferase)